MRFTRWGLVGLLLSGCDGGRGAAFVDEDSDGVASSVDCDDAAAARYPGAPEACDGIDNDCDGLVDEDPAAGALSFVDFDGDGYGNPAFSESFCTPPVVGFSQNADDCDDLHAAAYPGAPEVCDGIDNDCDGTVDAGAADALSAHIDADGDGYGEAGSAAQAVCSLPDGYADNAEDCDDSDAALSPETRWYPDMDGDGHGQPFFSRTDCAQPGGHVASSGDCDDEDDQISPDAVEVCSGADDDCDGQVDDADDSLDLAGTQVWYADTDGDGFGDPTQALQTCDQPSGYVADMQDCDDTSAAAAPFLAEVCGDGLDNDCDGRVDSPCLYDVDDAGASLSGDQGYGTASSPYFGHRAEVADISGDGVDDLLLSAYSYDVSSASSGEGAVFGYFGPISSGDVVDGVGDAAVKLVGASASDTLGYAMSAAADLDGDGYRDLAVGAYGVDEEGSSSGRVYVFYGPLTAGVDTTAEAWADVTVDGMSAGDYAGQFLVDGVDVDDDGQAELVVGAYGDDGAGTSAGQILLLDLSAVASSGLDASDAKVVIAGGSSYAYAGYSFADLGDADGDGDSEFLYGEPGDGVAYVLYGPLTASTLDASDATITIDDTANAGDDTGERVAGGDVNDDGYRDVLISTPEDDTRATDGGAVSVLYGPLSGTVTLSSSVDAVIRADGAYLELGDMTGALRVQDIDGDGRDDVVVSATELSEFASSGGAAMVFYGPLSGALDFGTDFDVAFRGGEGDQLGRHVATGDLNDDGDDTDMVVTSTELEGDAGAAYLFFGGDY